MICIRFACCDLDGDGRLTSDELRHFYKTQLQRITNLVRKFAFFVGKIHDDVRKTKHRCFLYQSGSRVREVS